MIKLTQTVLAVSAAAALTLVVPLTADAAPVAGPSSHVDATSLGFAGWRAVVPTSTASRAVVTVANTGTCTSSNTSVAVGAVQKGSGGTLGAGVYSQCLSGSQVIFPAFETTGGPVAMSTIGALVPGDLVLIDITTTAGFTTVNATGPLGSDTMTVPDIFSAGYRVGIWPLFATTAPASMPNFGILKFYKNVVNGFPYASSAVTKVHLVTSSSVLRAKTSPFGVGGDTFKVKWVSP